MGKTCTLNIPGGDSFIVPKPIGDAFHALEKQHLELLYEHFKLANRWSGQWEPVVEAAEKLIEFLKFRKTMPDVDDYLTPYFGALLTEHHDRIDEDFQLAARKRAGENIALFRQWIDRLTHNGDKVFAQILERHVCQLAESLR